MKTLLEMNCPAMNCQMGKILYRKHVLCIFTPVVEFTYKPKDAMIKPHVLLYLDTSFSSGRKFINFIRSVDQQVLKSKSVTTTSRHLKLKSSLTERPKSVFKSVVSGFYVKCDESSALIDSNGSQVEWTSLRKSRHRAAMVISLSTCFISDEIRVTWILNSCQLTKNQPSTFILPPYEENDD